jgi:3-deoxy-D-arabino-heptulosonate 7-phosphate (DAHP) synthase class II
MRQEILRAMIAGRLMYRDTHHLSYDGDIYAGQKFSAEQRAAHPQNTRNALK